MICKSCNKVIKNNSMFCPYCGDKQEEKVVGEVSSGIMSIVAFFSMILGNLLCLVWNFMPIYIEQEWGEYGYKIWDVLLFEQAYYLPESRLYSLLLDCGALSLVIGSIFSIFFFIQVGRGKRGKTLERLSIGSMLSVMLFIILSYVCMGFVSESTYSYFTFSEKVLFLAAVAFLNLLYFHREYMKNQKDEEPENKKLKLVNKILEPENKLFDIIIIGSFLLMIFLAIIIYLFKVDYQKVLEDYLNQACEMDYGRMLQFYPEEIREQVEADFEEEHCEIEEYFWNRYESTIDYFGPDYQITYEIRSIQKCSGESIEYWEDKLAENYGYSCNILSAYEIDSKHCTKGEDTGAIYEDMRTTMALIGTKWYVVDGFFND